VAGWLEVLPRHDQSARLLAAPAIDDRPPLLLSSLSAPSQRPGCVSAAPPSKAISSFKVASKAEVT